MDDPVPGSVQADLEADARRIDGMLRETLASSDRPGTDLAAQFSAVEGALIHHLTVEEAALVPQIQRFSQRDARVILAEHRYLRERLVEVRAALGPKALRDLLQEIAAHERTEARIVRQWLGTPTPR